MTNKRWAAILAMFCLLGLFLTLGCSKKTDESSNSAEEKSATSTTMAPATPIDPATAATVSGTVSFAGTAPKPAKIDMSQDPACKGSNESENMVVDNGKVANVFVYVKDGLGERSFDVPKDSLTIDQKGCRYHPHVLGVMTGQNIEIKNDDQTTHNIHPTPQANREWNESQGPGAPPAVKSFAREEVMLPVKCNQHPWMKMYVNVVKNPFFAVTDNSGKYEIKGLPPGTYTLAFVQEKLGETTQQVTVAPKDSKTVDVSLKGE
jgi:plastocyanin